MSQGLEWNPWHGCRKHSEGCLHCYVYRRDEAIGKDSGIVTRTKQFDRPLRRRRDGSWAIPPGSVVFACMTSDFFVDAADPWRAQAWAMIRQRRDVSFTIFTKRIDRFTIGLPADWGDGYENVTIGCTCESERRARERMPVFLALPIRRRWVVCEPMLGPIDLSSWLGPAVERVVCGGESGDGARPMDFAWALSLRAQCQAAGVGFTFRQTGASFVKDGRRYAIPRHAQLSQARRAGIDLPSAAQDPFFSTGLT